MKDLKTKILKISYKKGSTHLTSCLTAVDIIEEIFKVKKKDEKFVLSCGHAGLALYVVLGKGSKIFDHHGTHPDRCKKCKLDYSTGSLGHGIGGALGMALANRSKNVYVLISDGESNEGSVFEALRIKHDLKVDNLKVYCNINGTTALGKVNRRLLEKKLKLFCPDIKIYQTDIKEWPWLKEIDAHYVKVEYENL